MTRTRLRRLVFPFAWMCLLLVGFAFNTAHLQGWRFAFLFEASILAALAITLPLLHWWLTRRQRRQRERRAQRQRIALALRALIAQRNGTDSPVSLYKSTID